VPIPSATTLGAVPSRPPPSPLSRRFTGIGVAVVVFAAIAVVGGLSMGGSVGVLATVLGGIGIAVGLFLAVTAGFRIGPGAKFPQN
jgi:hypothetical protein